MTASFSGQTVIITGASAGIGEACARQFGRAGAAVVLAARGAERLEALADALRSEGVDALAVPSDVSKPDDCAALVERAVEHFGQIDGLVNNAGANMRGGIENYTAAELASVVQVNLTAPIVLTRLALPHLRTTGGAVVNVASLAGRVPVTHEAVYSATKFGLRAFTIAMAEEVRDAGVRMSVVSPGPVDTGFIMEDIDHVPDLVFSQPMSTSEEIASLVLACAADGQVERMQPRLGGHLATLAYVFPVLRRALLPVMERRGRKNKARFVARNRGS
ncbi:MAG: SDR family oxidoreductase [Myxococcota bacterium]